MTDIIEIIPDDLPDWIIDAMAQGQFARVAAEKVESLEAQVTELQEELNAVNHCNCERMP